MNLADFRLQRLNSRTKAARRRERRSWTHRDLLELCHKLTPEISAFAPDAFFSFDARGGIWAQTLRDLSASRAPVIIGFRLKATGPRKSSPLFDATDVIATQRWSLMIPPALLRLPRDAKILLVDDYTQTGETVQISKQRLVERHGFDPARVRTLALVIASHETAAHMTDYEGATSDAGDNDMFYMFRR